MDPNRFPIGHGLLAIALQVGTQLGKGCFSHPTPSDYCTIFLYKSGMRMSMAGKAKPDRLQTRHTDKSNRCWRTAWPSSPTRLAQRCPSLTNRTTTTSSPQE